MYQNKLPITELDTLDIICDNIYILSLKPKGLWTLEGNGAIDLLHKNGNYTLIDISKPRHKPNWKIYKNIDEEPANFTKRTFLELLH
jgi:hypothetical protein